MYEITSKLIKTDVTCIKCFEKYILAGIGGNLHLFDLNENLLQIYNVFPAQRIYGIIPNSTNNIAVFGGYKIKIIEFDFINAKVTSCLYSKNCDDWILDLRWINYDENITLLFANHYISHWTVKDLKVLQNVACEQRCLLYSALIVNDSWEDLFVFSGTIFSEILLWKPSEGPFYSPVICTLKGHDGVIFSINYNKELNLIISTSDDRTVRFWSAENIFNSTITELYPTKTIYGHSARVFKSLVINNKIISCGEDSNICVWDLDGKLLRKYESHQNGCVWALDKTYDGRIVSGGGDSGVSIYPFDADFQMKKIETEKDVPKIVKVLLSGNIVLINESGCLKIYNKGKWNDVEILEVFKSYVVMEVSNCREYLVLGGYKGDILIYKEKNNMLNKILSTTSTTVSRIYSIHWLTSDLLLTSENDGKLQLWKFSPEECILEPTDEFYLPPSKERWATSVVHFHENLLAVGDRKGNIHIYKFGNRDTLQTTKKAHNHLGITSLSFINNQLISMGRNGILKKFTYDNKNHLTQISNDKLPFTWLAQITNISTISLLIGFTGSNFIIWDHASRRILHEINCGGGHRSWDFYIDSFSNINFIFIKEKTIHKFSCQLSDIITTNIVEGYHTKEINTLTILSMDKHNLLLISGGEDTTLRLSCVNLTAPSNFKLLDVFKSHLSSVRCIKSFPIDSDSYIMVSAGGRAQIIVWKLQLECQNNTFEVTCSETENYYKKLEEYESEIRIMDLTLISNKDNQILIAACSDGTLRCYSINKLLKLECINSFSYALKCIIKVESFEICGRIIIISMATDGKLTFWDFTEFSKNLSIDLEPFYSFSAHQSGINSFSYKLLPNNQVLFASGGDDNALNLSIINFEFNDSFNVNLVTKYSNTQLHGAQITGAYICDKFVISTSIDQNISILKYSFNENSLDCILIKQYSSVIADIQGMSCIYFEKKFYVCVYGKGIEIININLDDS